ncbi:MAG: hypothetical protein AB7O24_27245 [Kofleriaceae bacterium]
MPRLVIVAADNCRRALHTWLAIIVAMVALSGPARAQDTTDETAPSRVVLADGDPELLTALVAALAPWRLIVVVDPVAPKDEAEAEARADAQNAKFVVWRDGNELVVYDRSLTLSDRRQAQSGPLDPTGAAAAALTVKTMMRLPDQAGDPPQPMPAPAPAQTMGLRLQAGFGVRIATGSQTDTGLLGELAGLWRPSSALGWRFGFAGDTGTSASVSRSGFRGTWSNWAVVAIASWSMPRGSWELEPWLGAGVARSSFVGAEMGTPRDEAHTFGTVRTGFTGRYRVGVWTVGASVGAHVFLQPPTYLRSSGMTIYSAPSFSLVTGVVVAADIGS